MAFTTRRAACVLVLFGNVAVARSETFRVPLDHTNGWQFLRYSRIRPNTFRPTAEGLQIAVTNSAAPAIFPLTNGLEVTELRVSGRIRGSLRVTADKQGQKGFDDYSVRVGLVEKGARTLTWRERKFSPEWIKTLFALAPAGQGISRIHFFNIGISAEQIGRHRIHPLSELMEETVEAIPDSSGGFSFTHRFEKPIKTVAVWVSCDGDDTGSSFAVLIEHLDLAWKRQ